MCDEVEAFRKISDVICNQSNSVVATLVGSTIDLEEYYASQISAARGHSRVRLRKELVHLGQQTHTIREQCLRFAEDDKIAEAKQFIATYEEQVPRCYWWCESQEQLESNLKDIYDRLSQMRRDIAISC